MRDLPAEILVPTARLVQICDEITGLRRRNEVLQAQVSVIELFGVALKAHPGGVVSGYGEDIVWVINNALAEAERKKKAESEPKEHADPGPVSARK